MTGAGEAARDERTHQFPTWLSGAGLVSAGHDRLPSGDTTGADVLDEDSVRARRRYLVTASALAVLTIASRALRPSPGLSYDELHALTHAVQDNLVDSFLSAWRFDVHPPLYSLQLYGWLRMTGVSEFAARANSWVISALCCVVLYAVGRRRLGERIGLLAATLFALAPYSVFQGGLVRMYALLMLLAVLLWSRTTAVLEEAHWPRPAFGMVAVSVAALATHGAAVLLWAGAVALVGAWFLREPATRWRRAGLAVVLQLACLASVLPWLLIDRREIAHPLAPVPRDVAETAYEIVAADTMPPAWAAVIATAIMATLVVVAVRDHRTRAMGAAFLITPLVLAVILSYAVQPIWLTRTLAAFVPFWCIAGAVAVERAVARAPRATALASGTALLLCLSFVLGAWQHPVDTTRPAYRTVADLVTARAHPGDRVVLDSFFAYWAFAWYALPEHRVDALDRSVQPASLATGAQVFVADRADIRLPDARGGTTWWLIESAGAGMEVDLREVLHHQLTGCSEVVDERVPVSGLQVLRVRC
jgi:mannosyltransferase